MKIFCLLLPHWAPY